MAPLAILHDYYLIQVQTQFLSYKSFSTVCLNSANSQAEVVLILAINVSERSRVAPNIHFNVRDALN